MCVAGDAWGGVRRLSVTIVGLTPGSGCVIMMSMTGTAEQDRYSNGQCHALAEALAEITGGQIVAWQMSDGTGHAMCRLEDGTYLDVFGRHTRDEVIAGGWLDDDEHEYDTALDLADEWAWEYPDVDTARPVAERIAASI